jgi:hypothetical protein
MHPGRFDFPQILAQVPHREFRRLARRYGPDSPRLDFSAWEHFAAMMFAPLTYRENLRDVEACRGARPSAVCHPGFRHPVRRSTLAYANERRDWRLFAGLAQRLMARARQLDRDEPTGLDIQAEIHALAATLIDLGVAPCSWAQPRQSQAAVRLNVLPATQPDAPDPVGVFAGNLPEVHALDERPAHPGASSLMDRGDVDLARLHRSHPGQILFLVRARSNRASACGTRSRSIAR